ncbi:hypothetical protein MKY85_16920 [Paenibacillus sp. FSL R5-0749]
MAKAGFAIEQLIEESDDELMQLQNKDMKTIVDNKGVANED